MKPVEGPITTDFFEPRPLSKPPEERDHIHGAIDIGAPKGSPIKAPEKGTAFGWVARRLEGGQYWPEIPTIHGLPMYFRNYHHSGVELEQSP